LCTNAATHLPLSVSTLNLHNHRSPLMSYAAPTVTLRATPDSAPFGERRIPLSPRIAMALGRAGQVGASTTDGSSTRPSAYNGLFDAVSVNGKHALLYLYGDKLYIAVFRDTRLNDECVTLDQVQVNDVIQLGAPKNGSRPIIAKIHAIDGVESL